MLVLTLQTAESQYPYLCEPALTNNYCPSFFLPTRGLRNSWSIDVPTFSRGNPPGPAAALHTTTTTDRCLWCLLHTDDRAVCAALSTRSWQRECWGRRSVIKRGSWHHCSDATARLHSRDNLFITSATDWYETTTLTFTTQHNTHSRTANSSTSDRKLNNHSTKQITITRLGN